MCAFLKERGDSSLLGPSWECSGRSLGPSWAASWAVLGPSWASWSNRSAIRGPLGPSWGLLGHPWIVLGTSGRLRGPSQGRPNSCTLKAERSSMVKEYVFPSEFDFRFCRPSRECSGRILGVSWRSRAVSEGCIGRHGGIIKRFWALLGHRGGQ